MATLANIDVPLWHMSVEKYHAMIESGILGPEGRVELLEDVLVAMSKNPLHSFARRPPSPGAHYAYRLVRRRAGTDQAGEQRA